MKRAVGCACGCGKEIEPTDKYGRPHRFILGHHKGNKGYFGKKCNWKGGRIINSKGYIWIYSPEHPSHDSRKYVYEHRLVWEKFNNAMLLSWVDIHHINGNKQDNRIENLEAMTKSEHTHKYHRKVII